MTSTYNFDSKQICGPHHFFSLIILWVLSRNIVSLQVFVHVFRFSPCAINLFRNKNIWWGLKKGVAKSRALVYFEEQILALLLVFHRTHNLLRNRCRHIRSTPSKLTNQRAAFLQPATTFIVARQVDHARGKTRNIDPKPATKHEKVTRKVEGFCVSRIRRLNNS